MARLSLSLVLSISAAGGTAHSSTARACLTHREHLPSPPSPSFSSSFCPLSSFRLSSPRLSFLCRVVFVIALFVLPITARSCPVDYTHIRRLLPRLPYYYYCVISRLYIYAEREHDERPRNPGSANYTCRIQKTRGLYKRADTGELTK